MKKISLTGIKPTGTPHLGNYVGAIRPALELTKTYDTVYFIADYHALTTVQNGAEMRANIYKVAATWLALGLNPEESLFYKQSDIPEIFEPREHGKLNKTAEKKADFENRHFLRE